MFHLSVVIQLQHRPREETKRATLAATEVKAGIDFATTGPTLSPQGFWEGCRVGKCRLPSIASGDNLPFFLGWGSPGRKAPGSTIVVIPHSQQFSPLVICCTTPLRPHRGSPQPILQSRHKGRHLQAMSDLAPPTQNPGTPVGPTSRRIKACCPPFSLLSALHLAASAKCRFSHRNQTCHYSSLQRHPCFFIHSFTQRDRTLLCRPG